MRGKETCRPMLPKLCMEVGIQDVITCANFGDDRLRDLGVLGDQILVWRSLKFVFFRGLIAPKEYVPTKTYVQKAHPWDVD